jgi:hypothetical protein
VSNRQPTASGGTDLVRTQTAYSHTSVDEDTPKWIRLLVIPLFKGDSPVARSRASRLDRGPSNTRA